MTDDRGPTTEDRGHTDCGLPIADCGLKHAKPESPAPDSRPASPEKRQPSSPGFIMPVVGPPIPRPLPGRTQAHAEFEKARQEEMRRRCCANCVNSARPAGRCFCAVLGQYPTLLVCANCTEAPGVLMGVLADGVCRNFRPRGRPAFPRTPVPAPGQQVCYIPLTRGLQAMVDPEDYEWLRQWRWRAWFSRDGTVYATTKIDGRIVFMHRLIMNPPPGMVVDHIDGNGVNNCRRNLRNCTRAQNIHNVPKYRGASRFKGVCRSTRDRWLASILIDGHHAYTGLFDNEVEAAHARDRWAFVLHGFFAWLNFPEDFVGKDPADPEFQPVREKIEEKRRKWKEAEAQGSRRSRKKRRDRRQGTGDKAE